MAITKASDPDSVVTTYTSDFFEVLPFGEPPRTFNEEGFADNGLCYGRYFTGQTLSYITYYNPYTQAVDKNETFDVITGTPSNPLSLEYGPDQQGLHLDDTGDTPDQYTTTRALSGIGHPDNGYGLNTGVYGKGSIAVLFTENQSKVKISVTVPNNRYVTVKFYNRTGSLLLESTYKAVQVDIDTIQTDAWTSDSYDIAGFVLTMNDYWGISITQVEFDVECSCYNRPAKVVYLDAVLEVEFKVVYLDAVLVSPNFNMYYINKDQNNFSKTAQYITEIQDLDSQNWKHIKNVDMIGNYGDNSINIAWTKTPDYTTWSNYYERTPTDPGTEQATRFYNLGHARRFAFDVVFQGNSNIIHNAIEVEYNIKTD